MSGPTFTAEQAVDASIEMLKRALELPAHDLALTALLSAYAAIATRHPCCQQSGIANLRHLANQLESMQGVPTGQPLH